MEPCSQSQRIKKLEDTMSEDHEMIQKLHDALLPTDFHPRNGLINRVEKMQHDIDSVQQTLIQAKTWLIAASGVIGAIIVIAQLIISLIEN